MASLSLVRKSNAAIGAVRPSLVAVFVGATSGIGEATAKQLATAIETPKIYIIGRSQAAGSRVVEELKASNPRGTFSFIQSDVSLLQNVDVACQGVKSKERAIDLLFMTPGHLATQKNDTAEGLENNHVLRYYARMRFIYNLLPLLEAAESPARVITVLAAGKEGQIDEDNFDLQKSFSFGTAAAYAATMNSLAVEYLAAKRPSISFIHVFPGLVRTPLMKTSFGTLIGLLIGVITRLLSISDQESGERNVFIATSAIYPPASAVGVESVDGLNIATASTGEVGGGSYLLNYDGADATNQKLMAEYREKGYPKKVWDHTLQIFQKVLGSAE